MRSDIQKLFAKTEANRIKHQKNLIQLQQSVFTYKTGLQMVKGKMDDTTAQYLEIVREEPRFLKPQDKILQLHRRAS